MTKVNAEVKEMTYEEMQKEKRCLICSTVGNWKNVDKYKNKKTNMCMCNSCGFITHVSKSQSKEDLKAFYQKDYRQPPTAGNFHTSKRKCQYHQAFLSDLYTDWGKQDKKPVIFDSGAAFGMFLEWSKEFLKAKGTNASVSGSEWTQSFKRVAKNHYGIDLADEIDETKKYDLIASYKVAEHQIDADLELRKFVELLKPDGKIYISVPTWFNVLSNFGTSGFDLDYYFIDAHINVWTEKLFRTLLKKVGLKIVKENDVYYDCAFLCERDDSLMNETPVYEDPKEIEEKLERIQLAEKLYHQNNYAAAIETWPNFPMAWLGNYERNRKEMHKLDINGIWEKHLKLAMESCPTSADIVMHAADVHARYNQFEAAIELYDKALVMRPNAANILMQRAQSLAQMSEFAEDDKQKFAMLKEARRTLYHGAESGEQTKFDCLNWIYRIESMLPIPSEVSAQ